MTDLGPAEGKDTKTITIDNSQRKTEDKEEGEGEGDIYDDIDSDNESALNKRGNEMKGIDEFDETTSKHKDGETKEEEEESEEEEEEEDEVEEEETEEEEEEDVAQKSRKSQIEDLVNMRMEFIMERLRNSITEEINERFEDGLRENALREHLQKEYSEVEEGEGYAPGDTLKQGLAPFLLSTQEVDGSSMNIVQAVAEMTAAIKDISYKMENMCVLMKRPPKR